MEPPTCCPACEHSRNQSQFIQDCIPKKAGGPEMLQLHVAIRSFSSGCRASSQLLQEHVHQFSLFTLWGFAEILCGGENHWFLPCRKNVSFGPFWLVVLHKSVWRVWGWIFTASHDAGSLMTHLTDKETEPQQHSSVLVPTTDVKEMTFNYHDLVLGG